MRKRYCFKTFFSSTIGLIEKSFADALLKGKVEVEMKRGLLGSAVVSFVLAMALASCGAYLAIWTLGYTSCSAVNRTFRQ